MKWWKESKGQRYQENTAIKTEEMKNEKLTSNAMKRENWEIKDEAK